MTVPEAASADLEMLGAATTRLLASLDGLNAESVSAPSMLPGWTRAHVLTHLARNADGIRNLALSARTGAPFGMYPSRPLRDADIEAGATRPPELVLLDARAAAERVIIDLETLSERAWSATVNPFGLTEGPRVPAVAMPGLRMREVEAHHVDLQLGYSWADSPAPMLASFLDQVPSRFSHTELAPAIIVAADLDRSWTIGTGDGPVIEGSAADLLFWALGRSPGIGLSSSTGEVPASPGWG
jgi:maleylpyruvate isomerase